MDISANRTPERVRHPIRFRRLKVVSIEQLTPVLRRIVLGGDDLEGFNSPGFDDHLKFFPAVAGQDFQLPYIGVDDAPVWPDPKPVARDYTPRAYDGDKRLLTIDFAVGHGGPATDWAEKAVVGDEAGVGGPRGSFIVPTQFAQHLLVGDEASLPAIARRLEELPQGVKAVVVAEVEDAAGEIELKSRAETQIHWVHRNGTPRGEGRALTQAALEVARSIDPTDAYVWVACESAVARAMRPQLLAAQAFNPKWMKVAGYWRLGEVGAHEVIQDEEA